MLLIIIRNVSTSYRFGFSVSFSLNFFVYTETYHLQVTSNLILYRGFCVGINDLSVIAFKNDYKYKRHKGFEIYFSHGTIGSLLEIKKEKRKKQNREKEKEES